MKRFNTTGLCNPEKHYMTDITDCLKQIKAMIDEGNYFCINRARQYGKTTTLSLLDKYLSNDYLVISLDFQDMDNDSFESGRIFTKAFIKMLLELKETSGLAIPQDITSLFSEIITKSADEILMADMFRVFTKWCRSTEKPLILIIDEVDTASNNQVFLDFLAQLRSLYLKREKDSKNKTFQSVILAGVTDVKHLKSKLRDEDQSKPNSPWNIAEAFNIDMSLSESSIGNMLEEYSSDHNIVVDCDSIAKYIHDYTNGYPYLVSRICEIVDRDLVPSSFNRLEDAWSQQGIDTAVKSLLQEQNNTLFESLTGKLSSYPLMNQALRSILMEGTKLSYNAQNEDIRQMEMYGFIRNVNDTVRISNRIFETLLYNLYLSEEELKVNVFSQQGSMGKNRFVVDGKLDVKLILKSFSESYEKIRGPLKEKFKEKDGREDFLLYLKPIINGTGNYYIEAETRTETRTDIIIDYLGQQYIIELKIWHGQRYNEEGEKQLKEYLDYYNLNTGYMLSFNFNQKKKTGLERIQFEDKVLYEVIV